MSANQRIKERRKELQISIEELADRMRPIWRTITAGMISKTENGERRVTLDEGRLWAHFLDCSLDDLADPLPRRYRPERIRKQRNHQDTDSTQS